MLKLSKEDLERLYKSSKDFESFWESLNEQGYVFLDSFEEPELEFLFARIYKYFLIRAKHKGVHLISPTHKQWWIIKDVAEDAQVFCKEFGLDYRQGFVKYLNIAQELGYLKLRNLRYSGDRISEYYYIEVEIEKDPNPEITFKIKDLYIKNMLIRWGSIEESIDEPSFHIHFVRFAKACHNRNINPLSFINIVFDIWSWTGEPLKPQNIYNEYTFKKDVSESVNKPVVKTITLKKGRDRYGTD
jgi:hypothetical protein